MTAGNPSMSEQEPSVGGFRVRPAATWTLFLVLSLSAAVALGLQVIPHSASPFIARLAPWVFLIFGLGFAGYRFSLVAARKYPPFKALLQVALAALFFVVLLSGGAKPSPLPDLAVEQLIQDPQPRVRALAAELAGFRDAPRAALLAWEDPEPLVQSKAHAALVRLNGGVDLGHPGEPGALERWRGRFP